jgi:AcrR family transcriptional regulator
VTEQIVPTGADGRTLSSKGTATRRRLLEAAEHIFGELGYPDASIVKVTEAAGVSQGTFYLYFSGKREIFDELVRDLNLRVRSAMAEGAARGTTRAEKEREGFRAFFRFTAEHPTLYRIIRQAEFVSPEMLAWHYAKLSEGYVEGLRDAMARGEAAEADPEVLAYALMGIGEMVGLRWIQFAGARELPDHVLDEVARIVARTIGAPE